MNFYRILKEKGPILCTGILLVLCVSQNARSSPEPAFKSKYIGHEQREIKSLSAEDIEELEKGAGWGLAKAAELNGMPGPKHILEMKKEINLTPEQEKRVIELYNRMQKDAVELGLELIRFERELNTRFADKKIQYIARLHI